MPEFGPPDAFGRAKLSEDERDRVSRRLSNLTNDPVRIDFGDPDVLAFTDRQRDRLTDDNGVPIRKDFEPFEPTVKRSDAWPESSVGEEIILRDAQIRAMGLRRWQTQRRKR
jgi:hypothetical protein